MVGAVDSPGCEEGIEVKCAVSVVEEVVVSAVECVEDVDERVSAEEWVLNVAVSAADVVVEWVVGCVVDVVVSATDVLVVDSSVCVVVDDVVVLFVGCKLDVDVSVVVDVEEETGDAEEGGNSVVASAVLGAAVVASTVDVGAMVVDSAVVGTTVVGSAVEDSAVEGSAVVVGTSMTVNRTFTAAVRGDWEGASSAAVVNQPDDGGTGRRYGTGSVNSSPTVSRAFVRALSLHWNPAEGREGCPTKTTLKSIVTASWKSSKKKG